MPRVAISSVYSSPLLRRSRLAREQSLRACARTERLIARALVVRENARTVLDKLASIAAEQAWIDGRPVAARKWHGWIKAAAPLPLTPPLMREIADEFRRIAEGAASPEVSRAFYGLAQRYAALAAGFDTEAIASRRLH